jgi:hypothetical protein
LLQVACGLVVIGQRRNDNVILYYGVRRGTAAVAAIDLGRG